MSDRRLWVIADTADAPTIVQSLAITETWPTLDVNGLGYEDLGLLLSVLRNRDGDNLSDVVMGDEHYHRRGESADTGVYAVGPDLVEALAQLPARRVGEVAARWSRVLTDEVVGPMGGRASVTEWVSKLAGFARLGRELGKPVLELLEA